MGYVGRGLQLTNDFNKYDKSFIQALRQDKDKFKINKNKKTGYYNVASSFDIETTSFYYGREKASLCYWWSFGINGRDVYGRDLASFVDCLKEVSQVLELNDKLRLLVYVHNLAFEFQFIRKYFNWISVFSIDERKPLYALTDIGIEFRCSYQLTGYSLAFVGEHLQKYKVAKMVGDLDYSLIRTPLTPLTDKEIGYCKNDIDIVQARIQEYIEELGNITKIPLTKTGFVRAYVRKRTLYANNYSTREYNPERKKYSKLMGYMRLNPELFTMLSLAFHGGFTHANAWYSGDIMSNVSSYDFTSSYPYNLVANRFPMGKGTIYRPKDKDDFKRNMKLYACLFYIELWDVEACKFNEHFISYSRCVKVERADVDNGRIVSAKYIKLCLTEVDYEIVERFYKWSSMRLGTFYRYKKDYLPKEFILAILDLYAKKTELKGVEGRELEYNNSKELLNSCFGMAVTNPVRDEIIYNNDNDNWDMSKADMIEALNHYNQSKTRFLSYEWGVWTTSYACRNLFTAIEELDGDYIYSDTDSVKFTNLDKHINYFNRYNEMVRKRLDYVLGKLGIDTALANPKTKEGKTKTIGLWDYEGTYTYFKTLGAKRYMTYKDNKLSLTISGVNKKYAIPYLLNKYNGDILKIFKAFNDGLVIPKEYTGKQTHTYIDYEMEGTITDYLGTAYNFKTLSGVHLEATEYSLSIATAYVDYLLGIKEIRK